MVSLKTKHGKDRIVLAAFALLLRNKIRRRKTRRWWVRPYVADHADHGNFQHFLKKNRYVFRDIDAFKDWVRLTPELFDRVLELITPLIEKEDTHLRKAVPPDERLAVTLRFLATGEYTYPIRYANEQFEQGLDFRMRECCKAQTFAHMLNHQHSIYLPSPL